MVIMRFLKNNAENVMIYFRNPRLYFDSNFYIMLGGQSLQAFIFWYAENTRPNKKH